MKKNRKQKSRARLQFESLESRFALAGIVDVTADAGGNLKITGDGLENNIAVTVGPGPSWVFTGNATVGGDGTANALNTTVRVNGGANVPIPVPTVNGVLGFRNVTIDMGFAKTPHLAERLARGVHGVDTVDLTNLLVRGNLEIKGKDAGNVDLSGTMNVSGETSITFGAGVSEVITTTPPAGAHTVQKLGSNINITGGFFGTPSSGPKRDLKITTGNTADFVQVQNVQVGKDLVVKSNAGDDTVMVLGSSVTSNNVGKSILLNSGAGSDIVTLQGFTTTTGSVGINTTKGGASDAFDNDRVTVLTGSIRTFLNISTGAEEDIVEVSGVDVLAATNINTGAGADDVLIGDDTVQAELDDENPLLPPPPRTPRTTNLRGKVSINMAGGDGNRLQIVGDLVGINNNAVVGFNAQSSSTSNTTLGADLLITGGKEEDCIGAKGVVIKGNVAVNTGAGDDFIGATDITVGHFTQVGNQSPRLVGGNVLVNSGVGNDIVAIGQIPTSLSGDFQSDIAGNVIVNTSSGKDIVAASNTRIRGTTGITLGGGGVGGADSVLIEGNSFAKKVTVTGDATDKRAGDEENNEFLAGFTINFTGELSELEFDAAIAEIFAEGAECFPDYVSDPND